MCILPGPMSFSGIMSLSLSCLPPNKQTQTKSDQTQSYILHVHSADKRIQIHSARMDCVLTPVY